MRDFGWYLLSGLVIVFWLSFGPRALAEEVSATHGLPAALMPLGSKRASKTHGLAAVLELFQPAALTAATPERSALRLRNGVLSQFQPTTASARLARRLVTPRGRLVRCGEGLQFCFVTY